MNRALITFCALAVVSYAVVMGGTGVVAQEPAVGEQEELRSLFLTEVEAALVERAVAARRDIAPGGSAGDGSLDDEDLLALLQQMERSTDEPIAPRRPPRVELSAIMYLGPDTWTIWLNGTPYTPGSGPPDIDILRVNPNFAELRVARGGDAGAAHVRLAPNQVFDAESGTITESRGRDRRGAR